MNGIEDAKGKDLSIVLPAFNEERGIDITLDALTRQFPAAEIIVVDDCSTDGTSLTVKLHHGVQLMCHTFNRGQGASLKTGMKHATRKWVAWFDSDNEHRAEDLARMFTRAREGNLAAVIGQRSSSANRLRGLGKWIIRLIGRGFRIKAGSDLNCGLRVFRRSVITRYLPLIPDRFSASLVTTLILLERGYPVAFDPVTMNQRIGVSTVQLRDGFEAILGLIRSILLFAPLRFFLPIGIALLTVGSVYSILVSWLFGRGIPVAGMFVMLLGILSLMLGLIADQISQLRLGQLPQVTGLDTEEEKT